MTVARTALLVVATAALAPAASAAPPPTTLKGKAAALEEPPPTQLARIGRPVPLGDELRLGDAAFAVKRVGASTTIATAAGLAPSTPVRAGAFANLTWKEGAAARRHRVGFCAGEDGSLGVYAATVWRYALAGTTVTLVDGDLDGRFGDLERDGWIAGETGFVLPLAKTLVVGRSRVTLDSVAPDGSSLAATVEPLEGTETQIAGLEALNRLRAAHGMAPAALSEPASRACTSHARYLAANGWTGFTNPHDEDPAKPGYTPEGQEAARRSVIMLEPAVDTILAFWRTWYHRTPIVSPKLEQIGIAADPPQICVLDVGDVYRETDPDPRWRDPLCFPADGASAVVGSFHERGEKPDEPVAGCAGRGAPLMLLFASRGHGATGFAARVVELRGGKEIPVPVLVGDPRQQTETLGCVPEAPLAAGASFRATFTFTREGRAETRVVRFRTK